MEYRFNGTITSIDNYDIGFQVEDGIISFRLDTKSILPLKERSVVLSGETDDERSIYLLIDRFYIRSFTGPEEDGAIYPCRVEGIVEAYLVLDSADINDIDSLGFYSSAIPKITGNEINGALNDDNASWMGIKNVFAKYVLNEHEYKLSIGFVQNEPFYSGQLLELKTDGKFDIHSIKRSYWVIKKFLTFLFQKTNVPIDNVFLRKNEENIGQLFVEQLEKSKPSFFGIKCIQTNVLNEKANRLLQLIADNKLYLRHLPIFKGEEKIYTPGRFLMALVGLENTLDLMDIHVTHDDKHLAAIDNVKKKLNELVDNSSGDERKIYKSFLNQLVKNENFEGRILASLNEDENFITNFFPLGILGDNETIAKDLSKVRNGLAHGYLDIDPDLKANYQMNFLMFYILYLQLKIIGFENKEASEIVPQIIFRH